MSSGATTTTSGAPELRVSETWDSCIENTITKLAYGTIFGGLAAIPLFRAPGARFAMLGLGAGIGVGIGYSECKAAFDKVEREQNAGA